MLMSVSGSLLAASKYLIDLYKKLAPNFDTSQGSKIIYNKQLIDNPSSTGNAALDAAIMSYNSGPAKFTKKYCKTNNTYMNFYDWLKKYTKYIKDISQLEKVKSLFYLDNRNDLLEKINNTEKNDRNVDMDSMIQILKEEGFLFIH
jgi:hypothetical protein